MKNSRKFFDRDLDAAWDDFNDRAERKNRDRNRRHNRRSKHDNWDFA